MIALTGCDRSPSVSVVPDAKATASPAPAIRAAAAPDFYEASGPLVVEHQVDVAAQREGMVASILVDAGTRVHAGQLLAELDNRQLQADRDAAQAKMLAIEADLKHWEEERKVFENDLARDEEMFKASLITQKQVEHSRYKLVSYGFEIDRERQNLKNAQETQRSLDLELEKTRIIAPFDGVVARRYIRQGQRVASNDRLFWVTATAPLSVKFTLPQEFAGKIRTADQVTVIGAASPEPHQARVTIVSPVVDPASGTIEVQAQLIGESPDLLPGMTASVRVKKAQ